VAGFFLSSVIIFDLFSKYAVGSSISSYFGFFYLPSASLAFLAAFSAFSAYSFFSFYSLFCSFLLSFWPY
jgi:hypothetical protein